MLEARGRAGSGARGSDDEVWFTFFRLQLQSSAEDFRSAYPISETFGSRFHDVDFVQELEEIARENRRSLLIHRKYHGGLTAEEAAELDGLQAQSEAALAAELELPLASLRALADEQ